MSHKLGGDNCLSCGQFLDGATMLDAKSENMPKSGDISVCLYCGHLMAFTDDLKFRDLISEEMCELAGSKLLLGLQEVRGEIMKNYKGKQQVSNVKK